MLGSLLIANRGEIARRIIRTCRRLGVRTVAVYSEADAQAPHVREADEAVLIGPPPAAESYLLGDRIIEAAVSTGAEAIHPGYGFLSENAGFAEAVAAAGLIWVGPPASAIRAMGLKDAAKTLMANAGVPVTPGYLGEDQSEDRLARESAATGWPVLIKAVAGGGGKGMRKVEQAAEFAEALGAARREAKAAFGDDRVLIEKYVTRPRHIEVQVFADRHGNVVHLFERDCSLQRRHQKVIEEAPAPGMDETTRAAVCAAAVKAAQAVGYEGAGTVEFIADASEGLRGDRIWFMEMNTRLQVEHPVTEAITGQDLVEWQLRVASGEPLPLRQEELRIDGWAMEARLYAENPAAGFLPSTGPLTHFNLPSPSGRGRGPEPAQPANGRVRDHGASGQSPTAVTPHPPTASGGGPLLLPSGEGIRIDSAVEEGGEVSTFYDPMIAKLIVHAPTREAAAARLAAACREVEVWPVKTNAAFLARCLDQPDFVVGDVDTGFIERRLESLVHIDSQSSSVIAAAAALLSSDMRWQYSDAASEIEVWRPDADNLFGFRLNATPRSLLALDISGRPVDVWVSAIDACSFCVSVDEQILTTKIQPRIKSRQQQALITVLESGERLGYGWDRDRRIIFFHGEALLASFREPSNSSSEGAASDGAILSPMPGKIVAVAAAEGAAVAKGAPLVTLEAMKMEHALKAPFDGRVAEVRVAPGEQVAEGALLVRLEPSPAP